MTTFNWIREDEEATQSLQTDLSSSPRAIYRTRLTPTAYAIQGKEVRRCRLTRSLALGFRLGRTSALEVELVYDRLPSDFRRLRLPPATAASRRHRPSVARKDPPFPNVQSLSLEQTNLGQYLVELLLDFW